MILIIEILLLLILALLCYQDLKDRKVTVLLLISGVFLGAIVHYMQQQHWVFLSNILINLLFVAVIFGILWGYSKLKMKQPIFDVFGKGDLMFFVLIAVSLPILSFLMVFIFSTFFALIIFILLKQRFQTETVPLAGLQSLFLIIVLAANKLVPNLNLYAL